MQRRLSKKPGCIGNILRLFGFGTPPATSAGLHFPYRRKDWLFTKAERSFFGVLEQVVGNDYRIFTKVRLCDLLWLPKGCSQRQSHQNRINQKHVDFILCTIAEVRPVLAIELDDASHDREDRKKRDVFVDAALKAAGLPLLHIQAKAAYNVAELRNAILRAIG